MKGWRFDPGTSVSPLNKTLNLTRSNLYNSLEWMKLSLIWMVFMIWVCQLILNTGATVMCVSLRVWFQWKPAYDKQAVKALFLYSTVSDEIKIRMMTELLIGILTVNLAWNAWLFVCNYRQITYRHTVFIVNSLPDFMSSFVHEHQDEFRSVIIWAPSVCSD